PPGASLVTMIKHVVKEENLAWVQAAIGAAMAPIPAAVGAAVAEVMALQNRNIHSQPRGPCWVCGRKGHIARSCSQNKKQGNGRGREQSGRMGLHRNPAVAGRGLDLSGPVPWPGPVPTQVWAPWHRDNPLARRLGLNNSFTGLGDTGTDEWPLEWPLVPSTVIVADAGGQQIPWQSTKELQIIRLEGKTAT
ncbi:hypothetical protein HGM15179_017536, partial [Zosterops borbonicus]